MIVPEVVGGNPIPSENWFRSSTTSLWGVERGGERRGEGGGKGWGEEGGGGGKGRGEEGGEGEVVGRGGERDGKE